TCRGNFPGRPAILCETPLPHCQDPFSSNRHCQERNAAPACRTSWQWLFYIPQSHFAFLVALRSKPPIVRELDKNPDRDRPSSCRYSSSALYKLFPIYKELRYLLGIAHSPSAGPRAPDRLGLLQCG